MTVSEIKQQLRQLKQLNNIVQSKLDEIETLNSLAQRMTNVSKNILIQKSTPQDKLSELIPKIVDLKNELKKDVDNLLNLKLDIIQKINNVENNDYKLLLTLRYLNFKTWEEIAVAMGYSYQWIHVLHGRALIHLSKRVDSN